MIKKHLFNVSKLNSNASKLALIAALSASSISYASSTSTYVGIDAVFSKMGFKKNYGENIFSKKVTPGVNVFVGHMFTEHFGAELGYEVDKKMKRTEKVNSGNYADGIFLNPNVINWASYDTTIKQRHPYLGFIAKTNIFGNNTFASLMLGVSVSNIEAKYTYKDSNLDNFNRTFSKTKPIATIKVVCEHKLSDKLGLRALIGWKNTSKFKARTNENSSSSAEIMLKNSFNIGIGATYNII